MAGNSPYYPLPGFMFNVEFTGGNLSGESAFQEVSGLKVSFETEDISVGGVLTNKFKLPKMPSYENLVLKRGMLGSSSVRDWILKAVNEYQFEPVTVQITLINEKGKPTMTWSVSGAWPVRWEADPFNSMDNKVAVEILELAYTSFTVKAGGS
ncbi:MAG: phage tail protein [Bacteroidota bacterium]